LQADVARELERLLQMDEQQRRVHAKAQEVCSLLTDACPRCSQAFLDFNGCCALTCSRCPCAFCAWCLADCGADAHRHVANCPRNLAPGRGVFADERLWREGRSRAKREAVSHTLRSLEAGLANKVECSGVWAWWWWWFAIVLVMVMVVSCVLFSCVLWWLRRCAASHWLDCLCCACHDCVVFVWFSCVLWWLRSCARLE
jgi:hypothetical protein